MIAATKVKMSGSVMADGLYVRHLTKSYKRGVMVKKKISVLKDVSFHVSPGEVLGIMGPSGAGKTTLANILLRMVRADSGQVWLNHQNILGLRGKSLSAFRRQVQAITQHPETALNPRMTIRECLGEVFRVIDPRRYKHIDDDVLLRMLTSVMLAPEHLDRYPAQLSGGELQRVVIARVMALRPKLIIADEPTSSLDMISQARIMRLMLEQRKKIGCSIILISHDADLVDSVCDRVHYLEANSDQAMYG